MDSIIFEIGITTIQLSNGEARFWHSGTREEPPVVVLPIDRLMNALSTARMLARK